MEWLEKKSKSKATKHYRALTFLPGEEQEHAAMMEEANRHVMLVPNFSTESWDALEVQQQALVKSLNVNKNAISNINYAEFRHRMRAFREGLIDRIGSQLFELEGRNFAVAYSLWLDDHVAAKQSAEDAVAPKLTDACFQALPDQDHDDHLPQALKGPNYTIAFGGPVYARIGKYIAVSNSPL